MLNPEQQKAVEIINGPVLVLAGAGSGKTRTLTHRVAYMIAQGISAQNILAVTFTNKAAEEMRDRVRAVIARSDLEQSESKRRSNLVFSPQFDGVASSLSSASPHSTLRNDKAGLPLVGTFHSVCAIILRQEIQGLGFARLFAIYDRDDQLKVIKKVMDQLMISQKDFNPRGLISLISQAKNQLQTSADFASQKLEGLMQETASRIYTLYQESLKELNALDFDDLIMKTVELWQKYPKILEKYQNRFQYLLIDEYQDTNYAQYVWTKLLAQKYKNIFVVGDDAQAIYGFRGADFTNILNFEKDYPKARIIFLEQNYRSTQPILDVGNSVIACNKLQKPKELWTQKKSKFLPQLAEVEDERAEGEFILAAATQPDSLTALRRAPSPKLWSVGDQSYGASATSQLSQPHIHDELVYESEDEQNNCLGILDKILASQSANSHTATQPHSLEVVKLKAERLKGCVAVLYRTNAQSRALEEVMVNYGVPYQIVGGVKFYQRKEIKDMIAYLRFLINPLDFISLGRIINEPRRGIGKKGLEVLTSSNLVGFPARKTNQVALKKFVNLTQTLQQSIKSKSPQQMIDLVLDKTGYKKYLESEGQEGESRLENIQELKTVASKYDAVLGLKGLFQFLEEVSLVSDVDDPKLKNSKNCLTMMTVHSAKGLEFDTVFVVGLEEGLFPHSAAQFDSQELEEERRLFYVAVTRAKNKLYLINTRQRRIYGSTRYNTQSMFLGEIGDGLVERVVL